MKLSSFLPTNSFFRFKTESSIYDHLHKLLSNEGRLLYCGQLLRRSAKEFGSNEALICGSKKITYRELYFRAVLLGKKLKEIGVASRDKVILCFENSPEFVITYFAIWQIGAVVVPLNVFLHEKEVAYVLSDAEAKAVVVSKELRAKFDKVATENTDLVMPHILEDSDVDFETVCPESFEQIDSLAMSEELSENELSLLLYTSGTTGVPKGVMLSSKNIIVNVMQSVSRFAYHSRSVLSSDLLGALSKERFLAVLPLFHVFAQNTCMWFPIMVGASIIIVPKIDRRDILAGLKERPTMFFGVPALYGLLCLMKTAPLDQVRFFVSGGDAMPDKIRSAFALVYGRKICSGYGLTETSPVIAVDIDNRQSGTYVVGSLLPQIDCSIRDESGKELQDGKIGALWLRCDNVMLGYYNAPVETGQVLQDGWLNTGDLAIMHQNGKLAIMGRFKDLIIHKGFNIYPQEVENVLLSHPAVFKAAVLGSDDETSGQVPVAFVALKVEDSRADVLLRKFCSDHLAGYKVPKRFVFLSDLPMNATGKVDKKRLKLEKL